MVERKAWGLKSSLFFAGLTCFATKDRPNWRCCQYRLWGTRAPEDWSVMLTMAEAFLSVGVLVQWSILSRLLGPGVLYCWQLLRSASERVPCLAANAKNAKTSTSLLL